jgi:hypothetical protein
MYKLILLSGNHNFDPAVLCAASFGIVIGNGFGIGMSRILNPVIPIGDKVFGYNFSALQG